MKTRQLCLNPKCVLDLFFLSLIMPALSVLSSCGVEDEPQLEGDNYSIQDIAGNWTATDAGFTSMEEPYKGSLDVIGEGGSLTISIQNNGRFVLTIKLPSEADQVFPGQLGFDEEWLAVSYDDDPGEYEYHFFSLNADKTVLTIRGTGGYDFDDDGVEDLASFSFILDKD